MKRYFIYEGHGFNNQQFLIQVDDWHDVITYVREHKELLTLSVVDWDLDLVLKTDRQLKNLQWRYA